jgi:hypothetical protein
MDSDSNISQAELVEKLFVGEAEEMFRFESMSTVDDSEKLAASKEDREDITIVAQDGTMKANFQELCSSSKYFKTMMSNQNVRESTTRTVVLKRFEIRVLQKLLNFISDGHISFSLNQLLTEIYPMADYFGMLQATHYLI